jgi:hypothetical protein
MNAGPLARARATARAIGFGNMCLFAASRALGALFAGRMRVVKYYFVAQPVAARRDTRCDAFSLAWADALSPLLAQADRPPAVIAARFAQGARCLLATAEPDRFAGFLWLVVGPYDEDEVRARFRPQPQGSAAWDFDVSIVPRYRMSRLFACLWQRAGEELAQSGVLHTMSRISAFNADSLAAHRRLGARIVGSALFVCAGRWQLMLSSLSPHVHLSWRDDQRPTLDICAA